MHRSRQATVEELDRADLVIALANEHVAWMRRVHPARRRTCDAQAIGARPSGRLGTARRTGRVARSRQRRARAVGRRHRSRGRRRRRVSRERARDSDPHPRARPAPHARVARVQIAERKRSAGTAFARRQLASTSAGSDRGARRRSCHGRDTPTIPSAAASNHSDTIARERPVSRQSGWRLRWITSRATGIVGTRSRLKVRRRPGARVPRSGRGCGPEIAGVPM